MSDSGHCVVAGGHAGHCLRVPEQQAADLSLPAKLRTRSASMGREARGHCSLLLRAQAARIKREANEVICDHAALTEHCVLGRMAAALETTPPQRRARVPSHPLRRNLMHHETRRP